jgi:fatty acid desaturase
VSADTLDTIAAVVITSMSVGFVWLCLNNVYAVLWVAGVVIATTAFLYLYAFIEAEYQDWRNRWH